MHRDEVGRSQGITSDEELQHPSFTSGGDESTDSIADQS